MERELAWIGAKKARLSFRGKGKMEQVLIWFEGCSPAWLNSYSI
jgi:hypothetical protein